MLLNGTPIGALQPLHFSTGGNFQLVAVDKRKAALQSHVCLWLMGQCSCSTMDRTANWKQVITDIDSLFFSLHPREKVNKWRGRQGKITIRRVLCPFAINLCNMRASQMDLFYSVLFFCNHVDCLREFVFCTALLLCWPLHEALRLKKGCTILSTEVIHHLLICNLTPLTAFMMTSVWRNQTLNCTSALVNKFPFTSAD